MINFILGVFAGCILTVIILAMCKVSGRADLEIRIMELEQKYYNLRIEKAELTKKLGDK